MIITVTMNPALDKTARVQALTPGALNRLADVRVDAGGKGINVSRMVHALSGDTLAMGFTGGEAGAELRRRVEGLGIGSEFLPATGVTRTNLKVVDAQGVLTELNEPGISVTPQALDALLARLSALAGPGDIVVLGGSLPRGAAPDTYYRFAQALGRRGARVIVDADGEAFRLALPAKPVLIKPNRFELLQYYGLPQETPRDALPPLCRRLLALGIGWVALSLGEEGAMFFTRERETSARALKVPVRSAVGAGDCMVGALAFALERGLPFEETVRLAMAASIAAVSTEGTSAPSRDEVDPLMGRIRIEEI